MRRSWHSSVLGLFLVTELPPPYKSGQAEVRYEGVEPQDLNVVLAVVFKNDRVGEPEGRNVNKGGVAKQDPTDDLYALVLSTNLAATSSMVWLMASFTLSGWLRSE